MLSLTDAGDGDPLERAGVRADPEPDGQLGPLRPAIDAARRVVHEAVETLVHPAHAAALARTAATDARTVARLLLAAADPRTAVTGETHIEHGVGWSDPIRLSTAKEIGRSTGTTVNDGAHERGRRRARELPP